MEGIRFFSGIATYETEFELPDHLNNRFISAYIDLGKLRELAEVYVNGESVGITWFAPYHLEISKKIQPGTNRLKIEVANTWANRLVGDAKIPEEERITKSNVTRLPNAWWVPLKDIPNEEVDLMESGLLGPVTITFF
jgi:hypothetical protein